jgi:serine/threonine protein phosphatase PrpC
MNLTASARTHAGRVRAQNEDAAICRPEQGLFAVIDGMGGQEAGEVAAAIAAAALAEVPNLPKLASETVLTAAMKEARARILQQAESDSAHKDMGAVATVARLEDNGRAVSIAHVGDTRAWLVDSRAVRQLTHDHVAEGDASAKRPVARDLGRKAMDGEWVETGRFVVARNDLLVLASDGLHDAVPPDELAAELKRLWREGGDADAISARLVALALARGGPDNVTVVAVRIGRFRRGQRRVRLNMPLTVGLFLAIAALAGIALFGRRPPAVVALPDRVAVETRFGGASDVDVEAGKTTTVAAGTRFDVRGAAVRGVDWRVEVGEGATFTLALASVDLEGAFTIVLGERAVVNIEDTRVKAGAVRIVSTGTGEIHVHDVIIDTPAGGGSMYEGPVTADERNVFRIAAPAADAPAPDAPAADAPAGDAPAAEEPPAPAGGEAPR